MRWCIELLFIGVFLVKSSFCTCTNGPKPKIAIVGGGIGGASTAHFLIELFHNDLEIDIFESNTIGGRLATIEIGGRTYESGGSVINSQNKYMNDFVELLELKKHTSSGKQRAAIWDGYQSAKLIATSDPDQKVSPEQDRLLRDLAQFMGNFSEIYKHQANGRAFDNVTDLISAMNPEMRKLLEISTAQHFHDLGYSKDIIEKVIGPTLITNYGQMTDVHGFVGFVSIAGAMDTGGLWSVKGRNRQVPKYLMKRYRNIHMKHSRVRTIQHFLNDDSLTQYRILYTKADSSDIMEATYDIVVIATPLTMDQKFHIPFLNFPESDIPSFLEDHQTTVATFVKGDINLTYFGLNESVDAMLSTNPRTTGINSISKIFPVDTATGKHHGVWKVFSEQSLTWCQLHSMFLYVDEFKEILWKAYPKYFTNARVDNFQLHDSLYHVNAIEWAASAMEMSAIAGKNVALLIHNNLTSCWQQDSSVEGGSMASFEL